MKFKWDIQRSKEGKYIRPKNGTKVHIHKIFPRSLYVEVKTNCGFTEEQLITKPDEIYKVIYQGRKTIVILEDGSKGVSKCSPYDMYSLQKGHDIAHKRAKIRQLQKQIDELSS